ncbi:BrnT family toxin [Cyclobacterium plantarum]|uniref:BrnT family toxin n=1 Tax=Cyclobacterium plantarum TaxID=2716263 RepID=UPI003F71462E
MDFEYAKELWEDPYRVIIEARTTDEERYLLVAKLDKRFWSAVFTIRSGAVRVISVRKSRSNEKEIYFSS